MNEQIKFGPAGASDSFYKQGHKSSLEMPKWLEGMGLNAFEYQCGRGVKISEESATRLGELAIHHKVALSVHSPYYINISTLEPEKYEKSIGYIMQTLQAAKYMRASRIVVHMGSFKGTTREEALLLSKKFISDALKRSDEAGFGDITLCIETMGKLNQMGTLDEVLSLCSSDERLLPTIDFGHLNSRYMGNIKTEDDYKSILDSIENALGYERLKNMHCHFSKIEYSKGGEVKHLTLDDKKFGPDFEPLARQLKKRELTPTIICESDGTQAEDAVKMLKLLLNS